MDVRSKLFITPLFAMLCACDPSTGEAYEQREGLLFDLTQDDVQQLHDQYVPQEDIELTTARLTAPFDCALYDDLCEQVSREDAIAFTAELVDLALSGAAEEKIETFSDEFLGEAMEDLTEDEDDDVRHRSSSVWTTFTSGTVRLQLRAGITTPVVGKRQAWTEARSTRRYNGDWVYQRSTILCANPGANTQAFESCGGGVPCSSDVFEDLSANSCGIDTGYKKHITKHERRSGRSFPGGLYTQYRLTSRGSGSLLVNGTQILGTTVSHTRVY